MTEPDIIEGWEGMVATVVFRLDSVPLPQLFEGVTLIVPDVLPTCTVTLLVVPPEVCVQSAGNTQE